MSIEQAWRQKWAGHAALTALLPVERLSTGVRLESPSLPHAVLSRGTRAAAERTSSGVEIERIETRLNVYSADLDLGKQVLEAARECFQRQPLPLSEGLCLMVQWVSAEERWTDDGVWELTQVWQVVVARDWSS